MYYRNCEEDTASSAGSATPPTPSAEHLYTSIGDDAWSNAQSETTKEVLQSVLKVRKSWKTLRGGETVWPLELEAALLEGLEAYVPDDSRETRLLGRFPRRNRFISDFIFEKTGKRRSAKQVGSRLQQLRESCGGKKLLHLLSPFRQPCPYPDSSASSDSTCTSPVSPVMGARGFPSCPRHTVIYIDILPNNASTCSSPPPSPMWSESQDVVRASDRPRLLQAINPTVAFVAPAPVTAHSQFTVYAEDRVVHTEAAPLTLVVDPVPQHVAGVVYSTLVVPEYWRMISESLDPTRFTIYQEVLKDDDASVLIFSATYKFVYPDSRQSAAAAPGFSATLDTLTSPHTPSHPRTDMHALISAASLDTTQIHDDRYPLYIPSQWSNAVNSRESSPLHGYHSPSSDSSACFPSDLSNYVGVGKFYSTGPPNVTLSPQVL